MRSPLAAHVRPRAPALTRVAPLPLPCVLAARPRVRAFGGKGRQPLVLRLQQLARAALGVPSAELHVFGSSANGFGNATCDLDMCLVLGDMRRLGLTAYDVVVRLAEALQDAGMQNVTDRRSARIPIVMFRDPESGIDCDICVNNVLALRNTALLRAYAVADPRVRVLAFVIKHWAKSRQINNPSQSTLSSYGYLLLLVHFLQQRAPPALPVLQRLPPDWDGRTSGAEEAVALPEVLVAEPEGDRYDTYFFAPQDQAQLGLLRQFCARNREAPGQLLAAFFHYYGFYFDYRRHVVTVRHAALVDKDDKAKDCGWKRHSRLRYAAPRSFM